MAQIKERMNSDNEKETRKYRHFLFGGENSDKIHFVAYFICCCPENIQQLSRNAQESATELLQMIPSRLTGKTSNTKQTVARVHLLTSAQTTIPESAAMISVSRRTGHPWKTASMTAWAALDESSFLTMNTTPGDSTTG